MKALIAVIAASLLVGCAARDNDPSRQSVAGAGGSGEVKEVFLSDGTRCAVVIGYYKGAITCDWQGEKR